MAVRIKEHEEKKIKQAILEAAQHLVDNGLSDWKMKLNNKRTTLAETYHKDRSITYSKQFLLVATKEQLIGVTLHEATHAILGKGFGHGPEFVKKCIEISPNADYAKHATDVPIRKYILTCPTCGYSGSNNVGKERYCGRCWQRDGTASKFEVKENVLKVNVW